MTRDPRDNGVVDDSSAHPELAEGPQGPIGRPDSEGPTGEELSGTFFGGVQGIAAALGGLSTTFAVVGVFAVLLGVVLLIFLPDLRLYGYIIMIAGGAALLLAMLVSFRTVAEAVTSSRGRYGTNTVLMILAFVGIAAVINFLAFENSARVDVTSSKQFSLAPRTLKLLESLNTEVEAKAFFVPGRNIQEELALQALIAQTEDFLREFQARSGRFDYEFIDPVVEPLVASEYEATTFPLLVVEELESGRRHHLTPTFALEQDLVTALLIVTGREQKQVYFLSGHGEADPLNEQPDTEGFGMARRGIESENYAVSTLNLSVAEDRQVLEEAAGNGEAEADGGEGQAASVSMLVVAAPKRDLPDEEAQVLHQYLRDGGSMMFLVDPDTPPSFRGFLASWGVIMGDGHVIDRQRNVGQSEIAVLARDQYISALPEPLESVLSVGQLTGPLDTTYYPGVTSLSPAEDGVLFFPDLLEEQQEEEEEPVNPPVVFGTALGFTSPDSWLIKDPTRNEPDEAAGDVQDLHYPGVALRAVGRVDEPPPENLSGIKAASMVVIGDSDFASNRHFFAFNNSDLFLNSVNWLVGDVPLASIRPKPTAFRALVLTKNEFNFMRYSSWLLLPILMAASGAFVWYRRR